MEGLSPEAVMKGFLSMESQLTLIAGSALRTDASRLVSEYDGRTDVNLWTEQLEKFKAIHNLDWDFLMHVAYARSRDGVSKYIGRLLSESTQ